jgi:3-oxoacyl-[acyl-carrier-protein] synthase II
MRRVALTGIGLVTALGVGTQPTWENLLAGLSGVGQIQAFDATSLRTRIGAEIRGFDPVGFVKHRKSLRMMTRADQLGQAAATLALDDARMDVAALNADRVAVYVGGNKEISDPMMPMLEQAVRAARSADGEVDVVTFGRVAHQTAYPLFYVEGLPAAELFFLSEAFGLRGSNTYFSGGAEASAVAVGTAARAVRRGFADVALAGGFDDAVSWWNLSKLDGMGILSDHNELGSSACRPFDVARTGTVLGEGSAFVVLEELASARDRGARVYAEVVGFGNGLDSEGVIRPDADARGLMTAMRAALRQAGLEPDGVDFVLAHGSGTLLGDATEARALRLALGRRAAGSSIKPATGHLVAAAGALNVAVAALAIHHQAAPPSLNLSDVDPRCSFEWIRDSARDMRIGAAVAVARGFEGQNVALALADARSGE